MIVLRLPAPLHRSTVEFQQAGKQAQSSAEGRDHSCARWARSVASLVIAFLWNPATLYESAAYERKIESGI